MRALKQSKQIIKEIDHFPYRRGMTRRELIGRAINRLRFKSNIWYQSPGISYNRIFQMVNDVRYLSGLEPMPRGMFDEGIQYRTIFADNYNYAMNEFRYLCSGDW
jgi:hypothetical protein